MTSTLSGSAGPPLVPSRTDSFQCGTSSAGDPAILLPVAFRGSWDDVGVLDSPEHETFTLALARTLGVQARVGYPGEVCFASAYERDLVWLALEEALRPSA